MTRASVDSRLRFGFSTLGVWVLLPAMGLAWSAFGASVVVLTAAGLSTYFGTSTGFGASTALGASTAFTSEAFTSEALGFSALAAGSSFDAMVRLRVTPACADADARTNAAIRMNLRMLSLPLIAGVGWSPEESRRR